MTVTQIGIDRATAFTAWEREAIRGGAVCRDDAFRAGILHGRREMEGYRLLWLDALYGVPGEKPRMEYAGRGVWLEPRTGAKLTRYEDGGWALQMGDGQLRGFSARHVGRAWALIRERLEQLRQASLDGNPV